MRYRPPYVHVLRRLRRAGLAVPLAVAVGLAGLGHEVSQTARPATAVARASGEPVELERVVVGRGGATAQPRASVLRAAATKRATRATRTRASRATRTRRAVVRPAWVRPSGGALTSHYGPRWGRMHRGIDFGAPYGSPIYAAASGVVTFAGSQGGYGRLVTIRHAGGVTTAYGHMSRTVVRGGQRVSAGQVIAYVGSEGRSTGPHLHFEVRVGGAYLNPLPFLRARGVRV